MVLLMVVSATTAFKLNSVRTKFSIWSQLADFPFLRIPDELSLNSSNSSLYSEKLRHAHRLFIYARAPLDENYNFLSCALFSSSPFLNK